MKKLLIASTGLVATAGIAAADMSMSGYAEIGMRDGGGTVGLEMHSDMDIGFKLSGASDNGLTFGASIDLDEVSGGINSTGGSQAINVSGAFGTLTMGDTDGALDKANAEVASLTAIADDHTAHAGYNGGAGLDAGDILRYDTSYGNFGVSASIGQDDTANGDNDVIAYGISTTVGTVALSVAAQSNDTTDVTAVSAKTSMGGLSVVANFSDFDTGVAGTSYEHTALGLGYTVGDVALSANFGSYDFGGTTATNDGFGIAANKSLGGGATIMLGYGSGSAAGVETDTVSLGLGLSF
jgi:outer membrane protein OmpU